MAPRATLPRLATAVVLIASGTISVAGFAGPSSGDAAAARGANDSDCFYSVGFGSKARAPHRGPHAFRIFARRNIWNTPIEPRAMVDPASRLMVSQLVREVRDQFRRGVGPWLDRGQYGSPVYRVNGHQRLHRVALSYPTNACRFSLIRAFARVPVPPRARGAAGTDGHLTIWQPSTDKLWEFWRFRRSAGGFHAGFGGAIRNVSRSPGHYTADSWPGVHTDWGATASGLPLVGGVITQREAAARRIPHALAVNLPNIRKGVAAVPALKSDGTATGARYLPEGARLRIDPRVELDRLGLPPLVLAMARAAQRYGIYVRDRTRAGAMFFAERGGIDPLQGKLPHKVLITFPWQHLQVMRVNPSARLRYTYPKRVFAPDGAPAATVAPLAGRRD